MEDRLQFFCQHKQGGRFGQRLVLAVKFALQFLDPSAILPRFHGTRGTRLAQPRAGAAPASAGVLRGGDLGDDTLITQSRVPTAPPARSS